MNDEPVESISVIVTPHTAAVWRLRWHYEGQRDIRPWHVDNLARMMREGKFLAKTQVAFMRMGGRYYLTNGQHTLAAVEQAGIPAELSVVVGVGDSMGDVAADFSRRDTHLTRQFSTALVAHGVHDEFGVTRRQLEFMTAASLFFSSMIGECGKRAAAQVTHDDKLDIVRRHGRLAATAVGYFDGFATGKGYLTRRSTVGTAMFCARDQVDRAEQFFRVMAADDGLRVGDPRKTLLEWLRIHSTPGGRSGTTASVLKKVATDHEFVKAIATAWNAWVAGRELKVIRFNFDALTAEFAGVGEAIVRNGRRTVTPAITETTPNP